MCSFMWDTAPREWRIQDIGRVVGNSSMLINRVAPQGEVPLRDHFLAKKLCAGLMASIIKPKAVHLYCEEETELRETYARFKPYNVLCDNLQNFGKKANLENLPRLRMDRRKHKCDTCKILVELWIICGLSICRSLNQRQSTHIEKWGTTWLVFGFWRKVLRSREDSVRVLGDKMAACVHWPFI